MKKLEFRSWHDFRAACAALPPDSCVGGKNCGPQWAAGKDTIKQALEVADIGWPEGMERVRSIALPAVKAVVGEHVEGNEWGWDVTGADYDVGEYLSGAPECWLTPNVQVSKPAITIMANLTSSGMIDREHLMNRGAAVVALTLALQASGYAVKVYACVGMAASESGWGDGNDQNTAWVRWALTDDNGGTIDSNGLLFSLAHPASPRVLGYNLGAAAVGRDTRKECHLPWPKGGPRALPPSEWPADLYLHAVHCTDANWEDAASVQKWVASQYETLTNGGDKQARE